MIRHPIAKSRWSAARIIRIVVAGILLWAAWKKFSVPPGSVTMYDGWVRSFPPIRFALPGLELVLAVWLASGWRVRIPVIAAIVLLSIFSALLAAELSKDNPDPCGCLETPDAIVAPELIRRDLMLGVARNLAMMTGLAYLLASAPRDRARRRSRRNQESSS